MEHQLRRFLLAIVRVVTELLLCTSNLFCFKFRTSLLNPPQFVSSTLRSVGQSSGSRPVFRAFCSKPPRLNRTKEWKMFLDTITFPTLVALGEHHQLQNIGCRGSSYKCHVFRNPKQLNVRSRSSLFTHLIPSRSFPIQMIGRTLSKGK